MTIFDRSPFYGHYNRLFVGGQDRRRRGVLRGFLHLGHSSIEIVKEYVQMFGRDLQQGFDAFNPLDNMNIDINRRKIEMKRK